MTDKKKEELVFGFSRSDVEQILERIYDRVDINHPQMKNTGTAILNLPSIANPLVFTSDIL